MTPADTVTRLRRLMVALREQGPLIHSITNLVVQNDTADAIAAVGGTQITLHTLEEARDAAALSAALAINLGTLDEDWLCAARTAIQVATELDKPWVLDPVAVGLTPYRTRAAQELLDLGPAVLKGNASEILSMAGVAAGGKGADSIHTVAQATDAAQILARRHGCIVVITGAEDWITDGTRTSTVANGQPLLGRMIGSGCMLTAVVGCYLGVAQSLFEAAQAAVAHFSVAGELACKRAAGPGTLKPLLIDALYHLTPETLAAHLHLTED